MRLERQDLPRDAINVNGMWLDDVIEGFTTLSATGRETLTKELTTTAGRFDGSHVEFSRLPMREISVEYVLHGDDPIKFRNNCTNAFAFLNVEDAIIRFNDEFDKYFIGTITVKETEERFGIVYAGMLTIICADPFKYSVDEYGPITVTSTYDTEELDEYDSAMTYNVGDMVKRKPGGEWVAYECNTDGTTGTWTASKWDVVSGSAFSVNYDGSYKTYPRFEVNFAVDESGEDVGNQADCGFVQFAKAVGDDYKRIQFGDADQEQIMTNPVFNVDFRKSTLGGFSNAASGTYHGWYDDANAVTSTSGIKPKYGTHTGMHGNYLTRNASASLDFRFQWSQVISVNDKKQKFGFMALCLDSNGDIVCGVKLFKTGTSGTKGKVQAIVDGTVVKSRDCDFKKTGKFGYSYNKTTKKYSVRNSTNYIKREGDTITFKLADSSTVIMAYPDTNKAITKVAFFLAKSGTAANATANWIRTARFDATIDENTFSSGDVLNIDCANADVVLNDSTDLSVGDVGNEWNDFYLDVGENVIFTAYSEWCEMPPTFKMYYRKRWL